MSVEKSEKCFQSSVGAKYIDE